MTHSQGETRAASNSSPPSHTHFFRDLPDPAFHTILRVYVIEDILLRCDTSAYARLCTVDRFFYYTLRRAVMKNLMILQAKREEYVASFAHILPARLAGGRPAGYEHIRRLFKNPYFNYTTYITCFLSTFDNTRGPRWADHRMSIGAYFAQAAPQLLLAPQPKTLTVISEGFGDPNNINRRGASFTIQAEESLEFQPNPRIRCLFLKKFFTYRKSRPPTERLFQIGMAVDQQIEASEFVCVVIDGELRPDVQDLITVSGHLAGPAVTFFFVDSLGVGYGHSCENVTVKLTAW